MHSDSHYKNFKEMFVHNLRVNGFNATMYSFGLNASRYIEYAASLDFYTSSGYTSSCDLILDLGSGHSILPTFAERSGLRVISIDINLKALKWQIGKSWENANKSLQVVLADAKHLPFRDKVFTVVCCISTIEHLPNEGDVRAAYEIGRVLKRGGLFLLSLPLSSNKKSHSKYDWASGIPLWMKRLFRSSILVIFRKFNVDRTTFYFERMYSLEDIHKRIIIPSGSALQECVTFRSNRLVKIIHGKIIPVGMCTILEYIFATLFMVISKPTDNMDAIVLKLERKW